MNIFKRMKEGLIKTKESIGGKVDSVLKAFVKIDEELFEELEEALIMADVGASTAVDIIEKLRDTAKSKRLTDAADLKEELRGILSDLMYNDKPLQDSGNPLVALIIGVNGVGKTTSTGKLAHLYKTKGKKVLIAAADTYRAAAIEQLTVWAERAGVDIVAQSEGTDAAAVIYDGINAAKARKADVLLCDTAGRLHNKKNLMDELNKIHRIIQRELPEANTEVLLVIDATTGQNAVAQVNEFSKAADITGLILTKLDGTAKGGIVICIKNEYNISVKLAGIGEGIDDLCEFDSRDFVDGIL